MGTKICSLGQFQEPHHNSKKSQKLIVRRKISSETQSNKQKLMWISVCVKNLFNFENMDPHPFSDCADHNAVFGCF